MWWEYTWEYKMKLGKFLWIMSFGAHLAHLGACLLKEVYSLISPKRQIRDNYREIQGSALSLS